MQGTLYLIPTTLGDCDLHTVLPSYNSEIIKRIHFFIVEDVRTTRRFLKKVDKNIDAVSPYRVQIYINGNLIKEENY